MKILRLIVIWIVFSLFLLPTEIVAADGYDLPVTMIVGHADEGTDAHAEDDGHAEEADAHAEDDGHAEEADAHAEDDGHAEEADGHATAADDHMTEEGHSDDAHGHDEPFTLTSLLPLFLGVTVATVSSGFLFTRPERIRLGSVHLGVIALTLITAVLHLVLGLTGERLLLLNGLGYLLLLASLYLLPRVTASSKQMVFVVLALYTFTTIAAYFWLHTPAQYDVLGVLSKIVEVALLICIGAAMTQPVEGAAAL